MTADNSTMKRYYFLLVEPNSKCVSELQTRIQSKLHHGIDCQSKFDHSYYCFCIINFNKTSIVTPAEFKGVIYVRSPDGPWITCRLVSRMAAFKELQQQICTHTGISPDVQQLLYGNKLIQSSSDVERLPNEATITLKLKLLGGGNCDICYSNSVLHVCDECDQTLCTECNDRVDQHPKRTLHKTSLMPASPTQACHAEVHCSTSCSLDSQEEDDAWLSPSIDKHSFPTLF